MADDRRQSAAGEPDARLYTQIPGRRTRRPSLQRRLVPEVGVLLGALLLSLPWEVWLMGRTLAMDSHAVAAREVLWLPAAAAFIHALLVVIAFEVVALAAQDRRWLGRATWALVMLFVAAMLVVTLIAESMATLLLERWEHAWALPTLASPGASVASLLQTVAVPLLLVAGAEWLRRVRGRRLTDRG